MLINIRKTNLKNNIKDYTIRSLTTKDLDAYNALLRYAFQVTEQELTEVGWENDEIKQSKFPVLQRADVVGCESEIDYYTK